MTILNLYWTMMEGSGKNLI